MLSFQKIAAILAFASVVLAAPAPVAHDCISKRHDGDAPCIVARQTMNNMPGMGGMAGMEGMNMGNTAAATSSAPAAAATTSSSSMASMPGMAGMNMKRAAHGPDDDEAPAPAPPAPAPAPAPETMPGMNMMKRHDCLTKRHDGDAPCP